MKKHLSLLAIIIISSALIVGVVSASTTISTNISTGGTLSVTGTSTLATTTIMGNVGIGTSTPAYKFTLNGNSYFDGNVTVPATSYGSELITGDFVTGWDGWYAQGGVAFPTWPTGAVGPTWSAQGGSGQLSATSISASGGNYFYQSITTVSGQRYIINFSVLSGPLLSFGIGTTAGGSEILSAVLSTGLTYSLEFTATSATTYINFIHPGGRINSIIGTVSVRNVLTGSLIADNIKSTSGLFFGGGSKGLRITNEGYVSVGNIVPSAILHIVGTSTKQFMAGVDINNYWSASTTGTGNTVFDTTGTSFSFLDAVGIGISTPTSQLQVATSTSNATTSVTFGKTGQNKGTCHEEFRIDGSVIYWWWTVEGAMATSSASCK
jgi:hypothetical protein